MDLKLFRFVNDFSGESAVIDGIMKLLSSATIYVLIGLLFIVAIISKKRAFALIGLGGIILGMGINYLITIIYTRPRPFVSHDVTLLIEKAPSASFPSDTTVIVFAAACALWLISKRVGSLFIGIAVLVAISRVYIGHHYPTDVLVGSIIGVLSTFLCFVLYTRVFLKQEYFQRQQIMKLR